MLSYVTRSCFIVRLAVLLLALGVPGRISADQAKLDKLMARIHALNTDAKYAEALKVAGELAEEAKKTYSETSPAYATAVSWMAFLNQAQGHVSESVPLFEQAVKIYEKVLPPDHPDLATSINNLGFEYQITGRTEEAERLYKRALEMREKVLSPDDPAIADSLNNIAQIYKSQDRIDEAEALQKRALAIRARALPADDPRIAQSLQNLAGTLELQRKFRAAEELLRRALDIRLKSQFRAHPEVAGINSKLAQNLYKQARYREAETLFRTALKLRFESQPLDHPDVASSSEDLALNQLQQNAFEEAEALLRQALSIRERTLPATHAAIARTLAGLAEVYARQAKTAEALATIRKATAIQLALGDTDEIGRSQLLKHIEYAWAEYNALNSQASSRELLDETLTIGQRLEHTEAATAVSRMAARVAAQNDSLRNLAREREELMGSIKLLDQRLTANLAIEPSKRKGHTELRQEISDANERLNNIDGELKKGFPEYFGLVKPDPLNSKQIAALLRPDEALISLVCGYNETYVWAVSRESVGWHRADTDRDWLSESVTTLRKDLDVAELQKTVSETTPLFNLALAHEIYARLLRPVEAVFDKKKHLIIVPCGPLTSLPFQLLVKTPPSVAHPTLVHLASYREADWLMRHYAISLLPAVTNLKSLRTLAVKEEDRKPLIGFGNPLFAAETAAVPSTGTRGPSPAEVLPVAIEAAPIEGYSTYWQGSSIDLDKIFNALPALPETEEELRAIAQELKVGSEDVLLGKAATETAVKQSDLARYRIVYFATHGLIAGEIKGVGEPALVLARPQQMSKLDDGLLTASEVSQLKLDADWVVLAACNTASAEGPGAAALSGLARAFFHAGARALLVSHWRVSSRTAARLTTSTFETKSEDPTMGRAEALRKAMLALAMDDTNPWNAYPAFWAAFEVVGEGAQ